MKKILLLLSILIIWGCGSRKVDNTKLKQESTKNEFTENKQRTEIQSEIQGESSAKAERKDLNVSIEPFGDYWFKYGGIEFKGNAKVTVNSSEKKQEKTEKKQEKLNIIYQTEHLKITDTTYKSVYNHKISDKKALPWWLWAIFGTIVYVAGIFTIPLFKYYTNYRIKLKS
ncbi:hypothetical protein [Elizabethkingia meningoseptica]|uniref:hypothetical protein n=1 Tax=Elizabethkingia meningoseptica TaxID=238 RepID=UPI000994A6FF|nr:hypothetical protein [Elizabethkingia meningoseptica]AQX12557.1 hypothetical protein BBD35_09315 [Elizabethkingia meningoseptica]OPB77213.1 hypothetical protein BAY31_04120 [Elizabethkingia meningoseptica]